MAVLGPERAEEEPLPSPEPIGSRRRPRPRLRWDGFPSLPDDRRRAWAITAVLGMGKTHRATLPGPNTTTRDTCTPPDVPSLGTRGRS